MALVEELLKPIEGDNPSGADLRYNPVYDAIREARRQDDDLAQGAWTRERKVADYQLVIRLATDALKAKSKDLQIAAWLTDALLRKDSFAGLETGISLCRGLIETFWDTLYPELEDGDPELRATPLDWLGTKCEEPVRSSPLNREGHGWYQQKESRLVGYEDQAKDASQKKAREALLNEGKLAPEIFDKAFAETPKTFYFALEGSLDRCLAGIGLLGAVCDEKFGSSAPSFGRLKTALEEVRHIAHSLLQKKRETEPDPVVAEAEPAPVEPSAESAETSPSIAGTQSQPLSFASVSSSEAPARRALVATVAAVAAALRRSEPANPAPYLMMRGLRWGDLRASAAASDAAMLEAPPTEVRQQIKRLASQEKWAELLDAAEAVMALPCSRAWLDLQRFVVESCVALGSSYTPIAVAIRSELRALLRDVPQLLQATLTDDTPAANNETRVWLREILAEPSPDGTLPPEAEPLGDEEPQQARWQKRFVDSHVLAKEALRSGKPDKALDIMHQEINRQRSARGRFQRRVQFVELCVTAGKDTIAQPILDDLIAAIDTHKLEEWEDRSTMAATLVTVMRASKKIQADAKEKQKFFDRICRLDPVQALNC